MALSHEIDLTAVERCLVFDLIKQYLPDTDVWAYGSRVNWTARPQSDLDLVVFSDHKQRHQVSDLQEAFAESDLPFRVDVLVWQDLPEAFQKVINRHHVILSRSTGSASLQSKYRDMRYCDAVMINPSVPLVRGQLYSFVGMADVTPGNRCVESSSERSYAGTGSRFRCGDTLMARITPSLENGKIARYCAKSGGSEYAHGSTEFIVTRGRPDVTDDTFAYYLARSSRLRQYAIGQMTGTSGRQRVPVSALSDCCVSIPPISAQRQYVHVLTKLDDKIHLNQQQDGTLTELIQAIYKAWFVPMRNDAEAKSINYITQDIINLFPEEFVNVDIGSIPKGWTVERLGDCYSIVMGQSPPSRTYSTESDVGLPFFQGSADFGLHFPKNRVYCSLPKRIAQPGSTLISVRAPVGHANIAYEKCCIGRGLAAVLHQSGCVSFTFHAIREIQHRLTEYNAMGTVFGAINKKQLANIRVVQPPIEAIRMFERLTFPLYSALVANVAESTLLANVRDSLIDYLLADSNSLKIRLENT